MKNPRRATHDARLHSGFTLVELLIAASIFSIIILSIYSAFQTGILTYHKADSAFELYQTIRLLFNRMELDLKNSFAYGDVKGSRFTGQRDSLDFFSVVDSYEKDEPKTDICRIKYELKELEDKNKQLTNKQLIRTNYKGLDALKTDIQQEGQELAADIEEIAFEYAYPTEKEGKPSFSWQDGWPAEDEDKKKAQEGALPLAVKITISLGENKFTKLISLPSGEISPAGGAGE